MLMDQSSNKGLWLYWKAQFNVQEYPMAHITEISTYYMINTDENSSVNI
jgi:hypothetical protein